METLKMTFLIGIVLGAIISGMQSMATASKISPSLDSPTYPNIEFSDSNNTEETEK